LEKRNPPLSRRESIFVATQAFSYRIRHHKPPTFIQQDPFTSDAERIQLRAAEKAKDPLALEKQQHKYKSLVVVDIDIENKMIRPNNSVMQDNNTACILLQSGNYDAANHVLRRGLHSALKNHLIKQHSVVQTSPNQSSHGPFQSHAKGSQDGSAVSGGFCFHHEALEEESKAIQSVPVAPLCPQSSSQPLSPIAMYNRAFMLSQSDMEWMRLSQLDYQQWASSIIFYNLALVYHTQGVTNRASSSQFLKLSLRFYELAASLLEHIIRNSTSEDDFNILLLRCAIANNLGHVHACMHSTSRAKQAFEMLHSLFEGLRNRMELTEDEYSFFFMNTVLQIDGLCVAPAA
jgi:hypothetical protein